MSEAQGPRRQRLVVGLVLLVAAGGTAMLLALQPASAGGDPVARGRDLYLTGCVSCHGVDGGGVRGPDGPRGPSLRDSGEAGAYYELSTGRMPLASSDQVPRRKPPAYAPADVDALVAYVATLGHGPRLPRLHWQNADLAAGGEVFRANCQACHSASGSGGALSYGRAAPQLRPAQPEQIAAAVRTGPGQMPVFGPRLITDRQLDGLVRYVRYLRKPADPGGLPIGRIGPIPEGFVAWSIGVVALLGLVAWIGTRAPITPEARLMAAPHDERPSAAAERARPDAEGPHAEAVAAACFLAAAAAAIGLFVVYWQGGDTQLEGVLLAVATGGIGTGIVVWAKRYMPDEEATEERPSVASSPEEIAAFTADFASGEQSLLRRRVLLASLGAAITALGAALLFPLRSLGPRPGRGLKFTPYRGGHKRVVRSDGTPVRPADLSPDGVITVWPEGHTDAADSPTLLIRTRRDQVFRPRPGRSQWTVDGIVAYSKLCTHVGCPVGLYQAAEGLLLCPCHQSTFNVLDGARPIFGPVARSLPQLPLAVDDKGYLIATGDFSSPVGPGFWDRER